MLCSNARQRRPEDYGNIISAFFYRIYTTINLHNIILYAMIVLFYYIIIPDSRVTRAIASDDDDAITIL